MKEYKISAEEFSKASFSRLATRPNNRTAVGEGHMSAEELKRRFDKQGELFRAKFNALVSIINNRGEGDSLSDFMYTGILKDHTLTDLLADIVSDSGKFASYLSVGDMTLIEKLSKIASDFEQAREQNKKDTIEILNDHMEQDEIRAQHYVEDVINEFEQEVLRVIKIQDQLIESGGLCPHDNRTDPAVVIRYPTDTEPGEIEYTCALCGEVYRETFTKLSRMVVFGGPEVLYDNEAIKYKVDVGGRVVLMKRSSVDALDAIFDYGVKFSEDGKVTIPKNMSADIRYRSAWWGRQAVTFQRSKDQAVNSKYFLRFTKADRPLIMLGSNELNVASPEWLDVSGCPLVTAPLEITLTYDWRA